MKRKGAFVFRLAAAGAAIGFAAAAWAVAKQEYLGQGLWRTSLWMMSRGALVGYLVGAAAAAGSSLLAGLFSALPRAKTESARALAVRLNPVRRWSARVLDARATRAAGRALSGRAGWALAGLLSILTVASWAAGWEVAGRARAEAAQRGRSIILIGIDTLRADCIGAKCPTDSSKDLTPNIGAFGAHGTVFANAIAQAPWTLASFASVFTGRYPAEHGAEHLTSTLGPSQVTLAEVLRETGYRTLGVVSGEYVTMSAGMAQGFERFDESQVQGGTSISSKAVTAKAIKLLRDQRGEPFFLFLHYFDPHWIYQDHDEYDFADGYSGRLQQPAATMKQSDFQEYLGAGRPGFGKRSLSAEELDYLRNRYCEDVAYTDAALGELFAFLDESGLRDSCMVILVADHGESFLEHSRLGHNNSLYREEIHVPLVIAGPSAGAGRVLDRPVETRAVFPTVLDYAGLRLPAGYAYPDSLLSPDPDVPVLVRSAGYTTVLGLDGRMLQQPVQCWWTSVQDGRWKLIKEHLRGRVALFDLQQDPGERRNCAAECPDVRRRLERELDRLDAAVRRRSPGHVPKTDEAQQRRLKSLGYL